MHDHRLDRRDFLRGTTAVLVLVPLGCSAPGADGAPPAADRSGCTTSTRSAGHTHELCVPTSDLDAPPASGATYASSVASGHAHVVTLTEGQLRDIGRGASATLESSSNAGHTHAFTVRRSAAPPPGGAGPYG